MAHRHWTGGAGTTDWFTAGNWNGHHVPTNADSAFLNSGAVVVANGLTNANKPAITTVNVGAHLTVQSSVSGFAFGCSSVAGTVISNGVIIRGPGDAESLAVPGTLRFIKAYFYLAYSYEASSGGLVEFTNHTFVQGESVSAQSGGTVNFIGGSTFINSVGVVAAYGTGVVNFLEGSYIDHQMESYINGNGKITFDQSSLLATLRAGNESALIKFPRNFGLGEL